MKQIALGFVFFAAGWAVCAQSLQPAPGAAEQAASLLNAPAMVRPPVAAPLGKNWFRLETDAHVCTTEVSAAQVAAVLADPDFSHQALYYTGKKSALSAALVSSGNEGSLVDFVSVSIAGPIKIRTPYRALVSASANDGGGASVTVRQTPEDSASNTGIKNLYATRYAGTLTAGGVTYTYIRIYTIEDVNASILPFARNTLQNSSEAVNFETLNLIIAAARTKAVPQ